MADPASIALGCIALLQPIGQTCKLIPKFVAEVRDARKEMEAIKTELSVLENVLNIIAYDMENSPEDILPPDLVEHIKSIVVSCQGAVQQIDQCIASHTNEKSTKSMKWATYGRDKMLELKCLLHSYQLALNIAITTVSLSVNRDIRGDTTHILNDTAEIREDTTQILERIVELQERLPFNQQFHGAQFLLQRYLESLTSYAASSFGHDSSRDIDMESRRPSPLRETELQDTRYGEISNLQARGSYPASSSTDTHSYHVSGSASESAPSVQARLSGVPLVAVPSPSNSQSTTHDVKFRANFPLSDTSWCKLVARPITIPKSGFTNESHTDLVYAVSQTEKFLISGSRDQSIRVWDLVEQHLAYPPLRGHNSSVHSIVTDEKNDTIVSCGGNGSIIVWQLSTGEMKRTFPEAHSESILRLRLNDRYLVSASKDCTVKVWNRSLIENPNDRRASEPFPQCVLRDHTAAINDIILTELEIITACGDRLIRVFDIDGGSIIQKMGSHDKTVIALALSPDQEFIFSAGGGIGGGDFVIYHKSSGQMIVNFPGHEGLIRTLDFIPSCNLLISGSYDETVAIWANNADGTWKKERTLDVKETQRILGFDFIQRQRSHDFTEMVRTAVENGAEPAAIASGRVFCMLPRTRTILCGAGCTIVGWSFGDEEADADGAELQPARTVASSSSNKEGKGKGNGNGRNLFRGLVKRP